MNVNPSRMLVSAAATLTLLSGIAIDCAAQGRETGVRATEWVRPRAIKSIPTPPTRPYRHVASAGDCSDRAGCFSLACPGFILLGVGF